MKFILSHFEELLPIAIFLIVMIYSAVGNKKRPPAPAPEQDDGEGSGYQYETPDPPPDHADDELLRTLDYIFKAKKPQPPAPAPTPRRDEWQESVNNRKIKDAKKTAAKAEAKAAQTAASRARTVVPMTPAMQASEPQDAPPSEYASAEQALNGVIWSEILQRPVALR